MVNYKNGVIYTIKTDTGIYVGSTTDYRDRARHHKKCVWNEQGHMYNSKLYQNIRENKGEYRIEIYKMCPCDTFEQLRTEEERVRTELNANLNTFRCYLSRVQRMKELVANNKRIVVCECGTKSMYGHLARHRKTKKHFKLLNNGVSGVSPPNNGVSGVSPPNNGVSGVSPPN